MPLGAVLCGGASRRMGTDKAVVEVDGVAMARRVAGALLAAGCRPVVAIGGDRAALERLGFEVIDDGYPGAGPLGGILTALVTGAPAVVVGCDLPMLSSATITRLIEALEGHDVAMARTDRVEPLCAVWSPGAGQVLHARFEGGERAVHRAIDGLDIAWVDVPATELRNVNTPGDLTSL